MSKVGIVKLVTEIGDDKIKFQALDECITNMEMRKGHNEFTFGSGQGFSLDGTEDLGIVLWLPRAKVKEILGK